MATYLVSLAQLCCGGGRTLKTNTLVMCGEHLQWMGHTWVATAQGIMHSLIPSHSGSRVLHKGTFPGGPCVSCTSQVQATQVPGYKARAQFQVGLASHAPPRSKPLGFPLALWGQSQVGPASSQRSWSQVVTLQADMNSPGSQIDMVSDWQPAHSLAGGAVSRAEIAMAPCLPPLAVTHLSLCLWVGRAINGSRLALFQYSTGCNPSDCSVSAPGVTVWC